MRYMLGTEVVVQLVLWLAMGWMTECLEFEAYQISYARITGALSLVVNCQGCEADH
jgi:hypothetical protein